MPFGVTKEMDMSRNAIQFQPGLSLVEFQARFGRDEQCVQALSRNRWPLGFDCPECGGHRGHALTTRPLMQCAVCRHQVSVTAGTILATPYSTEKVETGKPPWGGTRRKSPSLVEASRYLCGQLPRQS